MDYLASLYPPLTERKPYPTFYIPSIFLLTIIPFLTRQRTLAISITFPLISALCIRAPCYTFGNPSADYYNSGPIVTMLLWYIDFVLCTPREGGDAPILIRTDEKGMPQAWSDLSSMVERLKWTMKLMLPGHRGIGWNWQVKSVPPHPDRGMTKWTFVTNRAVEMVITYLRSAVMLVILGFSLAAYRSSESSLLQLLSRAMIGWTGAVWVWDRLCCFYSMAAAVTVALNMYTPADWPPLMGSIRDAWSVRQMWSVVYHQVLRRMLQQPAIRVTRRLGLKRGSLTSRYSQLFISFGISCLFHQFQMFNVTRKDMGEFRFFMAQPVAIMVEDMFVAAWKRLGSKHTKENFKLLIGYLWVFGWFSWSVPDYITALSNARIINDAMLDGRPLEAGNSVWAYLTEME